MMKILYFGTVCDREGYDRLLQDCHNKPSVAPLVFESALLDGMKRNDADVEIHSFPMIPTFPHSKLIRLGGHKEMLPCGYECRWLNTVNLPILKQITRRLDARKMLKRWGKANQGEGTILSYSIPPFLVKDIIRFGKKYGLKTIAIVPDLLRDMYVNENSRKISTKLKKLYLKPALKMQGEFDGYVYLTEAMRHVVAPDKPYMVMEGIADVSHVKAPAPAEKAVPRAVMYAGMLHEKYGIMNLVDAFEKLKASDVELWLFGDGTAVPNIQKRAQKDPRIRYFGTLTHDEILAYERRATLLVNPRDPRESFTAYSFPSKTIEYMLSGTPLLTTRLPGIPQAYFEYVFSTDDHEIVKLTEAMEQALSHDAAELHEMGIRAQSFIIEEKNACRQAAGIIAFQNEVKKL